jgi:carboxylate-amine ligase
MLEQVIDETAADAAALGCAAEIDRCRAIVGAGTSANGQFAVLNAAQAEGTSRDAALRAVLDWIAAATLQ